MMSKLSNIALRKIALRKIAGISDKPKDANESDANRNIEVVLKEYGITDPKKVEQIKREVKHGLFDVKKEHGLSPIDIARRRVGIVVNSAPSNTQHKSQGSSLMPQGQTLPKGLPSLFTEKALQAAAAATRKRNTDAIWSYGGATAGGSALGALLGGEGNRLKGAIIGALLANAANFGRRKWKYGKDVTA